MKHEHNAGLHPCPCCGYRAEIEQVPHDPESDNSGGYYIECKRAGCGITTRLAFAAMDDPLPGLIESWNRRTHPEERSTTLHTCPACGFPHDRNWDAESTGPQRHSSETK